MKTVTGRITVRFAGIRDAISHHLSGGIFIIRPFFFFFFAIGAYGLVIDDGQYTAVPVGQGFITAAAFLGTFKLFFPILHNFAPLAYYPNTRNLPAEKSGSPLTFANQVSLTSANPKRE